MAAPERSRALDHIVVVLFENRSLDLKLYLDTRSFVTPFQRVEPHAIP